MQIRLGSLLAAVIFALGSVTAVTQPSSAEPPDSVAVQRNGTTYDCRPLPETVLSPPELPPGPDGTRSRGRAPAPICPDGYAPEPLPVPAGLAESFGRGKPQARPPSTTTPFCPQFANGCYWHVQRERTVPNSDRVYAMTAFQSQENPYVDPFGHSLGQLWAVDSTDANGTSVPYAQWQTIETGWVKYRSESGPRLFVFWADAGYSNWCFVGRCPTATDCWTPYGGAVEAPNQFIGHNDVFHQYSINQSGNAWWVYHDNQWLGYFTQSEGGRTCWQRPFDFINEVRYGGEVFSSYNSPITGNPRTDMGMGVPGTSGVAAMFSQSWRTVPGASYYNSGGTTTQTAPYTAGFIDTNGRGDFRYGGDGHCCGIFNRGPGAELSVSPTQGQKRTAVTSGTRFYGDLYGWDPDGDPISYKIEWGGGAPPHYTDYSSHVYSTAGNYTVWGTVTDNYGASGYDNRQIRVCDLLVGGVCL